MAAPYTLILETATPHASLGLAGADGAWLSRDFQSDRHHNALIFAPLAELLDGIAPDQIGLVLVGSGPGSYSGTRVGIAAAQGVAIAAGCRAVALPSLLGSPGAATDCLFVGDARRGAFWTARCTSGMLEHEPELLDEPAFVSRLAHAATNGIPIASFEDPARFPLPAEIATNIGREIPTAQGLWQAWLRAAENTREAWCTPPPQPIYLKPPHITAPKRPWLVPG